VHIVIIVPAFNLAHCLRDCLASLLDQTHTDWSAVVVDDGSTDATAAVAARCLDQRIRLIRQQNAGVSAARNTGIQAALNCNRLPPAAYGAPVPGARPTTIIPIRPDDSSWPGAVPAIRASPASAKMAGTTLARVLARPAMTIGSYGGSIFSRIGITPDAFLFLDGDDWLARNALAVLAETLEASDWAVAAYGRYARVAVNGALRLAPPLPDGCLLERLLTGNLFANGGHLLIRREAIQAAGEFRTDLSYGEDWDYWTRLAIVGKLVAVRSGAPVLFVRERPGSAYLSHGADPKAYRPAIEAIYQNPGVASRLGGARLADLRRQADAETAWSVGRELIRHGNRRDGRHWLVRSLRGSPSLKRFALIVLAGFRLGPFRPYRSLG
jgi:cellulose synthase/poly-beta-1,6-N-acetylglucosamine synthase-like glycosyltransferase